MPIRYEYNSDCCGHLYMETRKLSDAQVITTCNVCGQGEYVLANEVILEDVPEPVYVADEAIPDTITEAETQGQ